MAERKKTKKPPKKRSSGRAPVRKHRRPSRRSPASFFSRFRKPEAEFREDANGSGLLKLLYVTHQQRMTLLRWALYIVVCIMSLVLQDVIMSRIHIFGATTDLAVVAILLIGVLEGSEVGSVFALLASIVYYFAGTAPGAYCVGFITVYCLLASVFRQQFWHRSSGSIILCAGIAMMVYELSIFGYALFIGLTRWDRILRFVLCGIYSVAVMIPMYQLVYQIGLIGGNKWKE